ncbi:MAG: hypothetical protein WBA12_15160 [Catalinimonas sp.]
MPKRIVAGGGVTVEGEGQIGDNITLEEGYPVAAVPINEQTDADVNRFCNSSLYKANTSAARLPAAMVPAPGLPLKLRTSVAGSQI